MPVTGNPQVSVRVSATTIIDGDLEDALSDLVFAIAYGFTSGEGSQQFSTVFSDRRSVTVGNFDTVNLSGGSLTNVAGETVDFDKVKGIIVRNRSSTASDNLQLFPITPAANDWLVSSPGGSTPYASIMGGYNVATGNPGGIYCQIDPGTGFDAPAIGLLNLAGSGTIDYDIVIFGTVGGS